MPQVKSPPRPAPPRRPRRRTLAEEELLAGRLVRAIRRETDDRVRGLRVKFVDDRVVVYGRCANFYCKQLVQKAALRLKKSEPSMHGDHLDNQIEVG